MDVFAPVQQFASFVTFQLFGLVPGSYWGEALNFFVYDVIKISILMLLVNTIVTITSYYFPMERVRVVLTQRRLYGLDYLVAALLGVVTPFCSCSSIPLFIGFLSARIPLGVTFAFLISSPLVNEASLYVFPSIFGWQVTVLYNLVGILIAMVGGLIISKLKVEKYLKLDFAKFTNKAQLEQQYEMATVPWFDLFKLWAQQIGTITKQIFPYVVLGVGIGALIHGFVPEALVAQFLAIKSWWVVPVAVLIGTPLYSNSIAIIPVVEALIGKGVPMGTSLAFMTAATTLSIPSALMLSKIMKPQLLGIFYGVTIVGIILMGYVFNIV